MDRALEEAVRNAAFDFLAAQQQIHGDTLPRSVLATGFPFRGRRVPLVSPQGIFKPAILNVPLSITTVADGPYNDAFEDATGLMRYRYRGQDMRHPDNEGLRVAMRAGLPLVYFLGIVQGWYLPQFPVFIVGDDPTSLTFTVAVDTQRIFVGDVSADARRAYVTRLVRQRLHQASFRSRVLQAYRDMCAMCRLRHRELLDAAHILPDTDPLGEPVINNGVALCKLHHAAFDANIVGIRPDLVIEVRRDVLRETDGPMLRHGLQGLDGQAIIAPHSASLRPNVEFLEQRYELFRRAG